VSGSVPDDATRSDTDDHNDGTAPAVDPARPSDVAPVDAGSERSTGLEPGAVPQPAAAPEPGAIVPASALARAFGKGRVSRPKLPGHDPAWARLLVAVGAVLVVLAGGVLGAGRVLASRYEAAIPKQQLIAPESRPTAERHRDIRGPLNFLLLGSDKREGNTEYGERSDTIIIMHINASLDRMVLLAIPRDLRVHIPAFEPTGFRGASHEKINAAFNFGGTGAGGVQLLSATLTELLGIRFDGAAVVDFSGFEQAVIELGGVSMCVDVRTESVHVGFDKRGNFAPPYLGPDQTRRNPDSIPMVYEPGCRMFNGWQALDFVRQRKTLPDGDYGRQRHQQMFLRALFHRAIDQGVARNPIEADKLVRAVGKSFTMDTNGVALADLMFALRNVEPEGVLGLQVPSEPAMIGDISYIVALPEAERLYAALRDDTLDTWSLANSPWVNRT
jgi:LCP family protein required for cell wall assembly